MGRPAAHVGLALLILFGGIAHADEPAKPPQAAAPSRPAPPPTPEQAAEAVLAAVKAKDDAALKTLAGKNDVDPWLVADDLAGRGEHDAAEAFAGAAPRADVERLPAYLQVSRGRAPETAERTLLVATNEALKAGMLEKVLDGAGKGKDGLDSVVRVRLETARARALAKLSRWAESVSVHRRAADAALALGWLRRAAELYEGASFAGAQASDWARSLECLEVLLPLRKRRGDELGAAETLGQIGFDREQMGNHAGALAAYEEALGQFQALKDEGHIAWLRWNTAFVYRAQGESEKEMLAFEGALRAYEAQGDPKGAHNALNMLGIAYGGAGDHAKALSTHERSLGLSEAAGDKVGTSESLVNMGNEYFALHDNPNARRFYERGLAVADEVGQHEFSKNALSGLGRMYQDLGEYPKAFAVYQDLLERRRKLGDAAGAAHWLFRIGSVHARRGDHAKALSTYEQALAEQERLGRKDAAATTLGEMGLSYASLGEFAKALSTQEQALARQEALGDKAGQSAALINMGGVYRSLGDFARATSLYERGLAIATEIGHRRWRKNALANIATVYLDVGESAKALQAFEETLVEEEALGDRAGASKSLFNMGVAYLGLGDPATGLEALQRAQKIQEALGDNADLARTLVVIGLAHLRLGDMPKAQELLDRGTRAARSRRLAPVLLLALRDSAELRLKSGDASGALRDAGEGLQVAEGPLGGLGDEQGAVAREQYAGLFEIGALAALRRQNPAELLKFLESGRAGALLDDLDRREMLRWKAESLPPDLRRLDLEARAKERAARDAYDLASRSGDLRSARDAGSALDEATEAVGAVTNRIQREVKQAARYYPRARTIEDIRPTLGTDQALVLYGLCQGEALALVLRHDSERIVSLGDAGKLVAACEALDAKQPDTDVEDSLVILRRKLVEPLALGEGVTQVLVSPEGPLCYLPFAALFPQTVTMTPSGTTHVLLLDEQGEPGRGILAVGDPDYAGLSAGAKAIYQRGRPLTALPATRIEASSIGTQTLLGPDASEERLQALLPTSTRWRAVHFACHGLVNLDKPMLSSLALTRAGDGDGFFTALEVLRTKIPADLVVLSACETATGKIVNGEGIVGLTRAFMFAGTPRVICSLWKVDDEATRALMMKFYELWNPKDGKPGLPTAEALRKAQDFVRSQEKWKHPYYWAAWVLWGLPS